MSYYQAKQKIEQDAGTHTHKTTALRGRVPFGVKYKVGVITKTRVQPVHQEGGEVGGQPVIRWPYDGLSATGRMVFALRAAALIADSRAVVKRM